MIIKFGRVVPPYVCKRGNEMITYYTYTILMVLTCVSYAWLLESSYKTTIGEDTLNSEWDYITSHGMGESFTIKEIHNEYFPSNFLHSIMHIWYHPDFYTKVVSMNVFFVDIKNAKFSPRAIRAALHKSYLDEKYIGHYYGFDYLTLIFDRTTILLKRPDNTLIYKPVKLINTNLDQYAGYTDIECHHEKLVEEYEDAIKVI
tara:strand:- start:128731 stop:129336 length:606 start_codon:yes stop_codon:yes gene_type:complete